jgi:hypothetical protein
MARSLKLSVGVLVAGAALAATAPRAAAESIGFMHMPSTVAQFLGYGYGAGHHAPIVRTPAQRPAPTPRRAAPPPCYGPLYPAAYAPIGCYDCGCYGAPHPAYLGAPLATPPTASPEPMTYRPDPPRVWR